MNIVNVPSQTELIKIAIAKAGTIAHLSRETGMARWGINKWLNGQSAPSVASLCRLSEYLMREHDMVVNFQLKSKE